MLADLLLIAVAGVGVDVGWRPAPEGRIEYIIQVTPEEIENLNLGDIIAASDVPPGLPPIAAYRVVVGKNPLPRELPDNPASVTNGNGPPTPSAPRAIDHTAQPAVAVLPTESKQLSAPSVRAGPDDNGDSGAANEKNEAPVQHNTNSNVNRASDIPTETEGRQASSTQRQTLWVLTTGIFALCLAGLVFATWAAADYRKKYRELLDKLPIPDGLPPDSQQSNDLPQKDPTLETQQSSAGR